MPRVFIVNFAGHDFSQAKKWGELVPLTDGYVSLGSPDRLLYEIHQSLSEAEPTSDWLLLSGLMILNAYAAASWMHLYGNIRMLVWDKKRRDYREIEASGPQLNDFLQIESEAPND